MKRFFILAALFLMTTTANAITKEALQAVIDSEFTASIPDIHKIELLETYRCRNCYSIKITGTTPVGPGYLILRTSQADYSGPVKVYYQEGSK